MSIINKLKVFGILFLLSNLILTSLSYAEASLEGDWLIDYTVNGGAVYNDEPHTFTLQGGVINGSGGGNGYTWTILGTISGTTFNFTDTYNGINYKATSIGTINGDTISGTWSDSNRVQGTFKGDRVGGSTLPKPTPTVSPQEASKRATATAILCNRGPQPGDDFVCTATVGPVDNANPAPSGSVVFVADTGNFRYGNTCQLKASPSSGATSSCSVTFVLPSLGAGNVVPVDANYQGDSIYRKSTSKRAKSTVAKLPKIPLVCFSEVKDACKGLNALGINPSISKDGIGYVTTSYFIAPVTSTSTSQPASLAAFGGASILKIPKRKGDISFEMEFLLKLKDNAAFKTAPPVKPFSNKLKKGVVLGSFKTTLKYGESKTTFVKVKSSAAKVLDALRTAQISNLNISVSIRSIRKQDKKPKTITQKAAATLQ